MIKHFKYGRYLLRHKFFVFVAGLKTKAPLWRLVIHDWSKFMPQEWLPYASFFYGGSAKPKTSVACQPKDYAAPDALQAQFDKAWLHHQHLNPHHWQHWTLREDSGATKLLEIPEHFTREMVADWMGAGRAITGEWDVVPWYERNKEIIQLHPGTRLLVERLLGEASR